MSRLETLICGILAAASATTTMLAQPPNLLSVSAIFTLNPTAVGSTSTNPSSFDIFNPGGTPVTITGFSITGANATDFTVSPGTCPISPNTLSPGLYCFPSLSFTPSALGLRLAKVVLMDVGGAPQTTIVTGDGVAATKIVNFSPAEVVFPAVPVGLPVQDSPTALVFVDNLGNTTMNVQSVTIAGGEFQDFQITSNSCSSVAVPPGGSCQVNLVFSPTATGSRKSSFQVSDDAMGGTQKLTLLGIGSPPSTLLELPSGVAFLPTASSDESFVTVINAGSEPVTINSVSIMGQNQSDFSLVQNSCQPVPYTLLQQTNCSLGIQFTPQSVGTRLATLEMTDSAPGSPQKIPLEGTGLAPTPTPLSFGPTPVEIGLQMVGVPISSFVILSNLSNPGVDAQISLQVQGVNASDFSVVNNCATLYITMACQIPITFTPSAAGLRLATLVATDSLSGSTQSVTLIGSGLASGSLLNAYPAYFSPVLVGATTSGSFSIVKLTSSPVTLTQFTVSGPNASDFSILENTCPTVLIYGCSVTVNFTPTAIGDRIAELEVGYSGAASPVDIPLGGFGLSSTPTVWISPYSVDFGATPPGVASFPQTVSISDSAAVPVTIDNISVVGADAKDFTITGNTCPTAPGTLLPGPACQLTLQCTPSGLGARVASLQLTDNGSGSPQSISFTCFGTSGAPSLVITPTSLNFNPLPLGSSSQQTLSLSNSTPVTFTSVQIVGADSADFSLINSCPTTLGSSSFCDISVTFTPSVTGLRVASLQLKDNAIGSPQMIPLAGMGVLATQSVVLSPNPLGFGAALGYSTTATLTVMNPGTENVLLSAFQIGGRNAKDFGFQSNDCPFSPSPLGPNQSCRITMAFAPSAAGVRLASLSVSDSAPGSPQSIGMVGEGLAPVKTLVANPASLSFPPTKVGTTDYCCSVTIGNTGTVPVTLENIAITGINAGDFSLAGNDCPGGYPVMNPGSVCIMYMDFTPSATGARTAQLNITSDASNSPLAISLSGTGE